MSWSSNELGKAADFLMMSTYLLPAQRAALFELMARTPGFTVVNGVQDVLGRAGVAIRWFYGGVMAEVIVSPGTYAYLGNSFDALIKFAIVNKAGQLP
jgi:hypothetical protein